jgi:DNA-directed RNA polymerase subunit RPC12/RpoP
MEGPLSLRDRVARLEEGWLSPHKCPRCQASLRTGEGGVLTLTPERVAKLQAAGGIVCPRCGTAPKAVFSLPDNGRGPSLDDPAEWGAAAPHKP